MPRATELVEWKCWSQGSEVQAAKRTNGVSASQRMPRRAEVVGLLVVSRQVQHNGDVFCWRV
jgi:hypothetical protein